MTIFNIQWRACWIVLFSMCCSPVSFAQVEGVDYQWKKSVDKEDIQVFSSSVPDSKFRAVRAQMMVKGSINSLVALLEDTENCSNWASLCKEVSLVELVSDQEYFVYIQNAVTFPIADRDLIAHITWNKKAETGKLSMTSRAIKNYHGVAKKEGIVRLDYALTQWHFTPKPDGYVLVESFAHIDPNGSIPAWIVNSMSRKAPFRSMKKIRKIIQSGSYDNVKINLSLSR